VAPPRQRRRITTFATVPDANTVIIGGLKSSTSSKTVQKLPFIGDIPLIGEFFKSQRTVERRVNLYIFLRPKILNDVNFESYKALSRKMLDQAEMDVAKMKDKQKKEFFTRAKADYAKARDVKPGTPKRHFDYQGITPNKN
ncbi:MAG: hypothetical protein L3J82_07765, partial [Planctomycetes bacterium]|nr:hypothetical protein [Planctomycetota bacterium]